MPGHRDRSSSDHHRHHLFGGRHHSHSPNHTSSSTASTRGRQSSPGARTVSPTVNAHGETTYPEALPSTYQDRFDGPARGTVIIGPEFPDVSKYAKPDKDDKNAVDITKYNVNAEEYFELVMPDGRSLQDFLNDQGEDSDDLFSHGATAPEEKTEEEKSALTEDEKEKEQNKKLRKILKEGGYVIFSDAYIQNHPTSSISILTNEYKLLSPPEQMRVEPDLDDKKRQTERIKQFILEAQEQHRPLFRLKTSGAVYGESCYERRNTSTLFEPDPGYQQM